MKANSQTQDPEKRIEQLEERVENLESRSGHLSHSTLTVILILGIWVIAAALLGFSPLGQENYKEILGTAGGATALIIFFF